MKSDIEKLYQKSIKKYYINECHGRKIVLIVFSDKTKINVMCSKLLLQIKLGRLLIDDETSDHIDGNCLNDSVDNLQVLSRSENSRKGPIEEVKQKNAIYNSERMKGISQPHIDGEKNGGSKLTNHQVLEIKELQKTYYRGMDNILATKYEVSRSTIKGIRLGYWRKNS